MANASALDAVEVRARLGTPSNPAVLVGVPGPPHEKFLELFLKFLDAPFSNELCFRNRHGSGRHQLRARARASRKVSRRTTTSRTMARGCRAFPGLLQEFQDCCKNTKISTRVPLVSINLLVLASIFSRNLVHSNFQYSVYNWNLRILS